jgi:hypothetical protein
MSEYFGQKYSPLMTPLMYVSVIIPDLYLGRKKPFLCADSYNSAFPDMTLVNSAGVKLVLLAILIAGLLNNYKVAVKPGSNICEVGVYSDEFTP